MDGVPPLKGPNTWKYTDSVWSGPTIFVAHEHLKKTFAMLTLSPPNLKMSIGTTFTFSIILVFRKQRI